VRARYAQVLTSSDDSGVVVMVSRPSAVPNEPWRANCELRVFYLSSASPTGHWGPMSDAYTVRARYGPVLTSSDDSGVVVTYWNMRLMSVTRDTSQAPMSSLKSVALEPAGGTKSSTMSVASLTSQSLRTHKALQHHSGP
jgi:hypothetical protein